MSDIAINEKGDAVFFDGTEWKPAQVAQNERGEKMAFDGREWQRLGPKPSLGRRALDAAGEAVEAVGDFATRASDYRDTQFAKGMGVVAGMPRMASDAINWAGEQTGVDPRNIPLVGALATGGQMLPTMEQSSEFMLDRAKQRPGFEERTINPVVDTAVQALFAGPAMGAAGRMGPLVNATAGAGSEAAGQATEGSSLETPARIAGGLAGGLSPFALAKGANVVKSAVSPFTGGGRDKIVGNVLRQRSADPEAAIARMEQHQVPESVRGTAETPGFRVDAGQASRDPGLMGVADVAGTKSPGMRAQVQANNAAVTEALDRAAAGLPDPSSAGGTIQSALRGRYDTLKEARSAAVDPLYAAARGSQAPVNPWPLQTYTADIVKATKGEPQAVMKRARSLLFEKGPKGKPQADRSASGAMATRQAVNDMLDNPQMGNYSRSLLMEMKSKLDDVLSTVPEEAAARTKFAEMSKPLEPFDAKLGNKTVADVIAKDPYGKGFLMPSERVPGQLMKGGDLSAPTTQKLLMAAGGDSQVKKAMASAYLADFRKTAAMKVAEDAAGDPMLGANNAAKWLEKHRGGALNILTKDQVRALEDITKALKDQAQPIPGRVGSQTYDRLGTESLLGAILSPRYADAAWLKPITKMLSLGGIIDPYVGANAQIMDRLFEVIQDPAMTAALMKKANAGNAKMAEPVLKRLAGGLAVSQALGRDE